jgi:hypothetical protein
MPITLQDTSIAGIDVGGLPDVVSGGRLIAIDRYTNDPGTNNASFAQMTNGGSFTWNKPAGCSRVYVICTGGGAGSCSNDSNYRGFGGGSGGTSIGYYDVSGVSSVAITTGSGTNGTRGTGSRPGTGGTSSFGGFCSATGGRGGGDNPFGGGQGGYGSGGNIINVPGGGGDGTHGDNGWEGVGGRSIWHKTGGAHNNGTGQNDTDLDRMRLKGRYGSGGGTCYGSQTAGDDWRAGGAGVVVVYSYS